MGLLELLRLLRKNIAPLIILPVLFAGIAGAWSYSRPDIYSSTVSMYILAQANESHNEVNTTDLNFSQQVANDVALLLSSPVINKNVNEALRGEEQSDFWINVSSTGNSRVLTLTVNGYDPAYIAKVADAYVDETNQLAKDVMGIESVNALAPASIPLSPSGPRRLSYVLIAAAVGLSLAIAGVILVDVLNTRVRSSSDVAKIIDAPTIGHFPVA